MTVDNQEAQPAAPGPQPAPAPAQQAGATIPVAIAAGVVLLLLLGGFMVHHAESKTNQVALSATPKPVTALAARAAEYRASRSYVGTIEPWIEAKIGPQFVAAYVSSVRVRPGDVVARGDVLASLDCRSTHATSQAVSMQARALAAEQAALAHEAGRIQNLLDGGFVSPNEVERKQAESAAEEAQLLATQAKLHNTTLEVNDCVLRAPFDAEVATRTVDPGAFVRPGSAIVSVVDRRVLRITADAPEVDFRFLQPGAAVQIQVLATGQDLVGRIARRAPAADGGTRTVHFELDVPDPQRAIPVGTTAALRIEVGQPAQATEIPLSAAAVRGETASIFCAQDEVAHARTVHVIGEIAGSIFVDPELKPGTLVISEGRALLEDGDKVSVARARTPTAETSRAPRAEGG